MLDVPQHAAAAGVEGPRDQHAGDVEAEEAPQRELDAAGREIALWGFFFFYVTCVLITWGFYTRRGGMLWDVERGGAAAPKLQPAE